MPLAKRTRRRTTGGIRRKGMGTATARVQEGSTTGGTTGGGTQQRSYDNQVAFIQEWGQLKHARDIDAETMAFCLRKHYSPQFLNSLVNWLTVRAGGAAVGRS